MVPKMWDKPWWESVCPFLILGSVCVCAQSPKKYGPHDELFFFLLKKEPLVLSELVNFGPCVSAETVKARA